MSLVNLNPGGPVTIAVSLSGLSAKNVSGRILTAGTINALNTFEHPDTVKPGAFTAFARTPQGLKVDLPGKSVLVLAIE